MSDSRAFVEALRATLGLAPLYEDAIAPEAHRFNRRWRMSAFPVARDHWRDARRFR